MSGQVVVGQIQDDRVGCWELGTLLCQAVSTIGCACQASRQLVLHDIGICGVAGVLGRVEGEETMSRTAHSSRVKRSSVNTSPFCMRLRLLCRMFIKFSRCRTGSHVTATS